jgi:hypothetical protein
MVGFRRAGGVVYARGARARTPGEPDADYLLRLTGWLRASGIPSRCFVRAQPVPGPGSLTLLASKSRKPVYIDFENWFLVLAFANMLRTPARSLVFEEALPDPEGATEPSEAPRAVELLIELSDERTVNDGVA